VGIGAEQGLSLGVRWMGVCGGGLLFFFFAPLLLARATYSRSAAPAPRWSLPLVFDEAYMGAISL